MRFSDEIAQASVVKLKNQNIVLCGTRFLKLNFHGNCCISEIICF